MHIRYPFAGAFAALVLLAGYLGLSELRISAINDKLLHFFMFFLLAVTLYWSVELPRRLLMRMALGAIVSASVASEFLQAAIDNGRDFDPADIAANLMGSFLALGLCQWYHKRMLERRRRRKLEGYGLVEAVEDLELGENIGGSSGQEMGVIAEEDEEADEAWDDMGGGPGEDIGAVDGSSNEASKQGAE